MDPDSIEAGPELDALLHRLLGGRADAGIPAFSTNPEEAKRAAKRFGGVEVARPAESYAATITTDRLHESRGRTEALAVSRALLKALLGAQAQ